MTVGQEWRRKRDLTIASAALCGCSQRFLADVFDLDPSRVNQILAGLRRELAGEGGLTRGNVRSRARSLRRG